MQIMQESAGKILQLSKDTNTDVGKLHISMDGLKRGVQTVNNLIKQVDSFKTGANSSQTTLAVSVHTSYSNFARNVERSYNRFCDNVTNTLNYFLG